MTHGQSPDAQLAELVRHARHLLFSFDGPIRSAGTGNPPAPYIHDALTACRESGRFAAIVCKAPVTEVRAYLDAHDLSTQIRTVAASMGRAVSALDASANDCLAITSSPNDIEAAQAAGVPAVGYAKTSGDANQLIQAGASAYMHSMADVTLKLRALPLPE